jgi:hypothetical protein
VVEHLPETVPFGRTQIYGIIVFFVAFTSSGGILTYLGSLLKQIKVVKIKRGRLTMAYKQVRLTMKCKQKQANNYN